MGTALAGIARELSIAVVGAHPDHLAVERRLADRVDGGERLRGRVVHGDPAGLLLLVLLRIVGGEVRGDALPIVSLVARAAEELRPDVERAFVRGADLHRRVPAEAQLLLVTLLGLDISRSGRPAIHAADVPALRLAVDRLRTRPVHHPPQSLAP